jgi:HJR/Mrr/RecB family endonuclease
VGDFILIAVLVYWYFYPTLYAGHYRPDHRLSIFLINFFLGWTIIAWIGLMVWAKLSYNRAVREEEAAEQAQKKIDAGRARRLEEVRARIAARPDGIATFDDLFEYDACLQDQLDHFWSEAPVPEAELAARKAGQARHERMSDKMNEIVQRELPALATRYAQLVRIRADGSIDNTLGEAMSVRFVEETLIPELRRQPEGLDKAGEEFVRTSQGDEPSFLVHDIESELCYYRDPDGLHRSASASVVEDHYRTALTACGWDVRPGGDVRGDAVTLRAERDGRQLLLQCRLSSKATGIDAIERLRVACLLDSADVLAIISSGSYAPDARGFARNHGVHLLPSTAFRAFAAGFHPLRGFPFEHLLTAQATALAAECVKVLALAGWYATASEPDDPDVVVVRAEHNRARMAIVCKCDNHAVGRTFVEAVADAAAAHPGTVAVAVATSESNFTRIAREAAIKRNVTLIEWESLPAFAEEVLARGGRGTAGAGANKGSVKRRGKVGTSTSLR